jgi:FdhD protein
MDSAESKSSETLPVTTFTAADSSMTRKPVATEYALTIIFNNRELATLLCSPNALEQLAVGFLSTEGFISSKSEIKHVGLDAVRGVVRVDTVDAREVPQEILFKRMISSGCGRGAAFYSAADVKDQKVTSSTVIGADEILSLAQDFQHASPMYQATHGVHSAALCEETKIVVHAEDIGRHNAVDKVFGRCLLEEIRTEGRILISSGRVSSEIAHKAAKMGIPIIVTISAPTTMSVQVAERMGITLVTSVRGGKLDVYANAWRISSAG